MPIRKISSIIDNSFNISPKKGGNVSSTDSKNPLKFIFVGDSVTKNLSIYEYGDDIIAVDYGIGFPGGDDLGVDFIIPDMSYLLENSHKVRGLFITHAHADHYAAVPHLLKELNVPIYANKLTQEYIKESLSEKQFKGIKENVSFHTLGPKEKPVTLGAFTVSTFGVNHSVPDSLGLVIDSPEGRIIHIADFKIDENPLIDPPMDLENLKDLSKDGVLCLVSDSLGSRSKGEVPSESTLNDTFPKVFGQFEGNQLFITTISSNVSRMRQIIDAASAAGRKVVPMGRSIDVSVKIARNLGYLNYPDDAFVNLKSSGDFLQQDIVYLIAGCFGQKGSALDRLSRGEHRDVTIDPGAVLVFSAEPNPPGVDLDVETVSSNFVLAGGEVIDHTNMEHLHVSGHGHRPDLSRVAQTVNPDYYIPTGGTPLQMHDYAHMVYDLGAKEGSVFELREGEVIEFKEGAARKGKTISVVDLYFDGKTVSPIVIEDRRMLSEEGVFVVIVPINNSEKLFGTKAEVVSRGFVFVKEAGDLVGGAKTLINKILDENREKVGEWGYVKSLIEKSVEKFLRKKTGRRPMVIVQEVRY